MLSFDGADAPALAGSGLAPPGLLGVVNGGGDAEADPGFSGDGIASVAPLVWCHERKYRETTRCFGIIRSLLPLIRSLVVGAADLVSGGAMGRRWLLVAVYLVVMRVCRRRKPWLRATLSWQAPSVVAVLRCPQTFEAFSRSAVYTA